MRGAACYVVTYTLGYGLLVLLYWAITGTVQWLACAGVLLMAELFRIFVNLFAPGHEHRSAQKYGAVGRRLAEKLRKGERS